MIVRNESVAEPVGLRRPERASVSEGEHPVHPLLVGLVEEAERSAVRPPNREVRSAPELGRRPLVESFD